ncbi:MAG: SDR family NAD(P)-dependent oxidoreductase [Dehalococcoidia bacterium]|nr:SDR family NAD(P)-dependent oxidoreductase [Dehalococcoidia bacterium]
MRLENKIALITGGGSGIGEASSELFAREGAAVGVCDLNADTAEAVADRIRTAGGRAIALQANVTDREDVERVVGTVINEFGQLDILVNSAGVSDRGAPADYDTDQTWGWVMDINVKGTLLPCRVAVEAMRQSGGGSIINLSSIYGLVGRTEWLGDGFSAYAHSKGAVLQITRDLAVKTAREGIRVNALCPGFAHTALTAGLRDNPDLLARMEEAHPMGRLGEAIEIANCALFLASDEASFVTGTALSVDGGYTAQ